MIVVDTGVPHTSTIVDAAGRTVTASLVLHGLTAGPLTERYTRGLQARSPRTGLETAVTTVHVPPAGRRWPRPVETRSQPAREEQR